MTAWYSRLILLHPETIRPNLRVVCAAYGLPEPTEWQLCQGVLRMWHRVMFRSNTVGTSVAPVRATWRARALAWRVVRGPALFFDRAITPGDFTGLASAPAQIIRHLLGAHHEGAQFIYDLELLAAYRALPQLRDAVVAQLASSSARALWLRDLVVFEGYHQQLLQATEHALAHGPAMTEAQAWDPDLTLRGYLRWCLAQPATPLAAWRAPTPVSA
jgi:hypothetical protein